MNLDAIKTEVEYKEALRIASAVFNNPPEVGTYEGNKFESLLTLIEQYERANFFIDRSD